MLEWISVEDRLPEEGQLVDLWDSENKRRITDYRFYEGYGIYFGKNIRHWMPLPEPPK